MKYFSPNILDGSVTTAKIADLAVTGPKIAAFAITTTKIFQVTTSQSGTIAVSGSVIVALDDFNFMMDTEVEGGLNVRFTPVQIAVPDARADLPEFTLNNLTGLALLYDVAWRHVST